MKDVFYDIVEERASCRNYKEDPIPEEVLDRILAAAAKSPSGGGFQAISIIKITDAAMREKLVKMSRGQTFLRKAPVSLVFCADYHRMMQVMKTEPAPFQETIGIQRFMSAVTDAAIAAQTAVLAAQAEGLGSCYNGNVLNVMDQLSEMLHLPEKVFPVIMVTLGYPKGKPKQAPKYPASVLVHENGYREKSDGEVYADYLLQNEGKMFSAKPVFIKRCCAMAEKLQGPAYAEKVRKDIEAKNALGPYQFWFGCYYLDEAGFMDNADYMDYFRRQRCEWFRTETPDGNA